MFTFSKAQIRLLGFAAAGVLIAFTLACINRPMKRATPDPTLASELSIPQSAERDVDMLFVIDNSGSMLEEQTILTAQFTALMQELRNITGGLPNVHLGVVSTDLGLGLSGSQTVTKCEDLHGDEGELMVPAACSAPIGAKYIVDVEPAGCTITKDASGFCSNHGCQDANCTHEGSTTLVTDPTTGCPRCRNYPETQELEDVFTCVADLGIQGCGFEQQLEAMYQALTNPTNAGFVRENAFLAIIFITDEDDCSAAEPRLFDDVNAGIDSTLGPFTSYRCFEFGVQCDQVGRMTGTYTNCVPMEPGNSKMMLHPISRYVDFLNQQKDPQMLVVAAIAGPVPTNGTVQVGLDAYQRPAVQPSCEVLDRTEADPGIRMKALIEAFNEEEDMSWAYTSICANSFTDALEGIGSKIKDILEFQCLPAPLKGCSDPGAEFTAGPQDSCDENDVCLATCTVTDVQNRGTAEEKKVSVPACLEVCPSGPCDGNDDRNQAYAGGHPDERDPGLPVEACWHINFQEMCPQSNFAEIIISRKEDPPPRTFAEVGCAQIPQKEQLCNDGVDNDEDCLVDMEDPDCQ